MPEEANERLVKLYLESKGFLVFAHHKALVEKNRRLEADIVAIRLVGEKDNLPNRIIGEVKSYKIANKHFKSLSDKQNLRYLRAFKILNNPKYRKAFLANVEGKYGKGFEFCIFAREMPKQKEKMREFLDKERIGFVSHRKVVKGLIESALKEKYSNDSELQLIRLMKEYGLLRKEKSEHMKTT
jgi:hypothetical protein